MGSSTMESELGRASKKGKKKKSPQLEVHHTHALFGIATLAPVDDDKTNGDENSAIEANKGKPKAREKALLVRGKNERERRRWKEFSAARSTPLSLCKKRVRRCRRKVANAQG